MQRAVTYQFRLSILLLLSLPALFPLYAQDATCHSSPLFRCTLSGYETWFVESPRGNLAVAGLGGLQGPVVLLERSTGLVLRELSTDAVAYGAAFSADQELVAVAERYALRIYETATGKLLWAQGLEMAGPDIAIDGRALYFRGRVEGKDALFRLDTGNPSARNAWVQESLPVLPPQIVLGTGQAAGAAPGASVLPRDLAGTFFRITPAFFLPREDLLVSRAQGAVVLFDRKSGHPARILSLGTSNPELFECDSSAETCIAYASVGADHFIHLWRLDEAADSAAIKASRIYRIPLHPVRIALAPSKREAWLSGYRGGRDIGGGMIVETVHAAGMLDLQTGAWTELKDDDAPSWAEGWTQQSAKHISRPGRPDYRMLDHGAVEISDPGSGEPLAYLRVDGNGDWAAFAPDGRWDGSPGGFGRLLYMSDGLRTWTPDTSRDRGYAPGFYKELVESFEAIRLTVSTERGDNARYRVGEELVILVTVDRPVWLRLYHVDESGLTQLVWPNDYAREQWIHAGTNHRFPPSEHSYSFQVTLPGGMESILAIASTSHFLPGDPSLPDTGKPDRGSPITRGYPEPHSYPAVTASARVHYMVEE